MMEERNIAVAIKNLANQFHRYMNARKSEAVGLTGGDFDQVTDIQARIVSYLFENQGDEPVYQRDIEKRFNIRRSTATSTLKRIERNGLIRRSPSAEDARMKVITLTARARRLYPKVREEIEKAERQAAKNLSDVELALFFRVIDTMSKNIN